MISCRAAIRCSMESYLWAPSLLLWLILAHEGSLSVFISLLEGRCTWASCRHIGCVFFPSYVLMLTQARHRYERSIALWIHWLQLRSIDPPRQQWSWPNCCSPNNEDRSTSPQCLSFGTTHAGVQWKEGYRVEAVTWHPLNIPRRPIYSLKFYQWMWAKQRFPFSWAWMCSKVKGSLSVWAEVGCGKQICELFYLKDVWFESC